MELKKSKWLVFKKCVINLVENALLTAKRLLTTGRSAAHLSRRCSQVSEERNRSKERVRG